MIENSDPSKPEHIPYPDVVQYRNVVREVELRATYTGKTEDGECKYDPNLPKPILTFTGTVKLHGTNAAICLNYNGTMWFQSREQIITIDNDNAGFARLGYT